MIMNSFSRLLSTVESDCLIKSFHVGQGKIDINHIQFANNQILLFEFKDDEESLQIFLNVVSSFGKTFGHNINLQKSEIINLHVDPSNFDKAISENMGANWVFAEYLFRVPFQ